MFPPVMTIREVAEQLRLAEKTVYGMAAAGEFPAFKIRGQWRVRGDDLDAWLRRQAVGGGGEAMKEAEMEEDEETASSAPAGGLRDVGASALGALTERVTQAEMHRRFVEALGTSVRVHGPLGAKPLELELAPPLPQRARVYMYNATRPPGGRPLGEHKVQLIVPGQGRGARGNFDNSDGRIVILAGYSVEDDVFVLWDAGIYHDFAWSRNVQVKAETIIEASAGKVATQDRTLRPSGSKPVVETLVAAPRRRLAEAIVKRMELTTTRLLRED